MGRQGFQEPGVRTLGHKLHKAFGGFLSKAILNPAVFLSTRRVPVGGGRRWNSVKARVPAAVIQMGYDEDRNWDMTKVQTGLTIAMEVT